MNDQVRLSGIFDPSVPRRKEFWENPLPSPELSRSDVRAIVREELKSAFRDGNIELELTEKDKPYLREVFRELFDTFQQEIEVDLEDLEKVINKEKLQGIMREEIRKALAEVSRKLMTV